MSNYLSIKLSFFSFWLIVLVVLLHASNVAFLTGETSVLNNLEYFIKFRVTAIAVPLFFMISGYLFFVKMNGDFKFTLQYYKAKLLKKNKTLLVPYLMWCLFWFSFMFVIQILPGTNNLFGSPLYSLSLKELLLNLLGYPLNYPFWFLRELIVYMTITPLIFFVIKKLKFSSIILLLILSCYFDNVFVFFGIKVIQLIPFLYFYVGCYIGINKTNIELKLKKITVWLIMVLWFSLSFLTLYFEVKRSILLLSDQLYFFINCIGCIGIWFLYDLLSQERRKLKWYYKYSFFVFAFHGIPILFIRKIISFFQLQSDLINFAFFLISFIITVVLSIAIAIFLERKNGKMYKIIVGNR